MHIVTKIIQCIKILPSVTISSCLVWVFEAVPVDNNLCGVGKGL